MTTEESCQQMKSEREILTRFKKTYKRYHNTEASDSYNGEAQEHDAGVIDALAWVLGIKLKGHHSK